MKKIAIVAPHPDDETLGCGGTIIKYLKKKYEVHWIIATKPKKNLKKKETYLKEIKKVNNFYNFKKIQHLKLPAIELDNYPKSKIIKKFKDIFSEISANYVFIPFDHDAHSDHEVINHCVISSLKWFRQKTIEKILIYEVLSETNFNFRDKNKISFKPNFYIDISDNIKDKIKAFKLYKSESHPHPFPRNSKTIESLALIRGSESGFKYAEAFRTVYQREY